MTLHLGDNIYIIKNTPFLLIIHKNMRILIAGDLHIGQEDALAGYHQNNVLSYSTKLLVESILQACKVHHITHIILNGDIKHNTTSISNQERFEYEYLLDSLRNYCLILVKGNHDLMLTSLDFEIDLFDHYTLNKNAFAIHIVHGHEKFTHKPNDIIILGHEHTAYTFRGNLGERVKLQAFAILENGTARKVIVLPSANNLSSGTNIPLNHKKFLSPILQNGEFTSIQIFPFHPEHGIFPLPKQKLQ